MRSEILGLDKILRGGFPRPSAILIAGPAGSGKTTIAMQSIFTASEKKEVCMYVTSLNEPIAMVNNFMSKLSFYNISLLSTGNMNYIPIGTETLDKGIYSFMWNLEESIEKLKPDRIVIDPITAIGSTLDKEAKRRFYYDLFLRMKKWNALVIATGEFTEEELMESDLSHVSDGVILLSDDEVNKRRVRHLEILKLRGQGYKTGKHPFTITDEGIILHKQELPEPDMTYSTTRVPTGVPGLDIMTEGGVFEGSTILLSGNGGTGKTTIGTQFIAEGANSGEKGMIVSFVESEKQTISNARSIGHEIEGHISSELVKVIYTNPSDLEAGEHAIKLRSIIKEMGIKRIFVDDIQIFNDLMTPFDAKDHIKLLADIFRSNGVTSVFAQRTYVNETMRDVNDYGMDSLILLSFREEEGHTEKEISVLKMRGSSHDTGIRQFEVRSSGVDIMLPSSQ
ncbi:ATPase domain-containing protein [Methanococcoides methylutens]|uniref:ATPase domain-containing protein n=1 Tax=Methanococcoides methylutens TaxID=2226 RepID=UPI0040440211